ncbi:NADAR family protein [Psychromonas arctica]|uniref:NADAR family protein n=1 Tax=Psychromonas arctica TaxID=168275 RepID=UPI00040C5167|nr:NADAR family protein [Psychromonas arctica]
MSYEFRQYDIRQVAAFKRTKEKWGELSNMAGGFPVVVNGIQIKSVEALYQACRFPDMPEVQERILQQSSPMTAKMVGKPFREHTRKDWDDVRIKIMKWALRVKLAQNWERFSSVLIESSNMPIVELSNKDDFWGAKPTEEGIYVGVNALGRLLMQLREQINNNEKSNFMNVLPLDINNFNLYGNPIKVVFELDASILKHPQNDMFDV